MLLIFSDARKVRRWNLSGTCLRLKNLLKTLVAFANTAGGQMIIGVDDRSRLPVGVENPLDEEERLCSLIADSIRPRLVPNVEMTTVNGKTLLVVEVFLSGSRPHWLQAERTLSAGVLCPLRLHQPAGRSGIARRVETLGGRRCF